MEQDAITYLEYMPAVKDYFQLYVNAKAEVAVDSVSALSEAIVTIRAYGLSSRIRREEGLGVFCAYDWYRMTS